MGIARTFLTFILVSCIVAFSASARTPAPSSAEKARLFVQGLGDKTLTIVQSQDSTLDNKEVELRTLFTESVDTVWIGRFVMGRYWLDATPAQQEEFSKLYTEYLTQSYVPNFKNYTDEKFTVENTTMEDKDEYLVQTQITRTNQPSVRVDYKIRYANEKYQIFDIIAEGISMITTQRSEFGAILARNSVDKLIQKLKAKVAQGGSKAAPKEAKSS